MIWTALIVSFFINVDARAATRPLPVNSPLTFDVPIDYNREVRTWIKHFQGPGRSVFSNWLKRSYRYLPQIQKTFAQEGLPQDLAYIAMIESGFSMVAVSPANAVGPWQFIEDTGQRWGLTINW
jgi:membrane-bound lytic murein transglycosylase D